jgi:predicted GNAT family N-acyltransferase
LDSPYTKTEKQRTIKADTSHPIIVIKSRGKLVVLDGVHRLVKSVQQHKKQILGKLITQDQLNKAKNINTLFGVIV